MEEAHIMWPLPVTCCCTVKADVKVFDWAKLALH